jgi:5-methylcytosine-specific restriction enzyme subunit McrC
MSSRKAMLKMRRLTLNEFRTERSVQLSSTERDALRRLNPGLTIEPSPGVDGLYDITPDQRIGLLVLPDLSLEIRPKIEMSSVLFLLSYAVILIDWSPDEAEFGTDVDIVDLVAVLLARSVEHATRRGLLFGYLTEDESLAAPRGRIRFDDQIRRRQAIAPPVEVRHDVFTSDIIENRLLLSALVALSRVGERSDLARHELARAERAFGGVRHVRFARGRVPEIALTLLNRHYESALALAALVLRSTSVDIGSGGANASAFLVDMNMVFERFVRRALRTALGADARTLPDVGPRTYFDETGHIPLKPDLCLLDRSGNVLWIGDAKYKRLPADAYRNGDVYQLFAYTVGFDVPRGTLIYAADDGVANAEYPIVHSGKTIEIFALDLARSPRMILRTLDDLGRHICGGQLTRNTASVAARRTS